MTDPAGTAYDIRYWRGPLDGGADTIVCDYPPDKLNGYKLSHSMNGRYYLYAWPRTANNGTEPGPR